MDELCYQCKDLTGTVLLGSERDKAVAFCGICAISQLVCEVLERQGMNQEQAAGEWTQLREKLDQAYAELQERPSN